MVVLDASIVLKWFRQETDSDKALKFRKDHIAGINQIVCPALVHYELFNVLITKRNLSMDDILGVLEELKRLQIALYFPNEMEIRDAAIIALEKEISFYDATYVALANALKTDLITADKKLTRQLKLPFVKLL